MSLPLLLQFGAYGTNNLAGVMMAYDGLPGLLGQWGKISRHWLPPFTWGVYYKGKESSSGEDDVWLGGIKWELLTVPPCKALKCSLSVQSSSSVDMDCSAVLSPLGRHIARAVQLNQPSVLGWWWHYSKEDCRVTTWSRCQWLVRLPFGPYACFQNRLAAVDHTTIFENAVFFNAICKGINFFPLTYFVQPAPALLLTVV